MIKSMSDIINPGASVDPDPDFPNAPEGWTKKAASEVAITLGIDISDDIWEAVRVVQGCYRDEVAPRLRLVRDALDARFGQKGGFRYLTELMPGGPITHACLIAGVEPPTGAKDLSFGSMT